MEETFYFIAMSPPMPLAGQIPVCWGPVAESKLEEYVEKFHLQGNYIIYEAGPRKYFTVKTGEKTEIAES